MATINVSRLGLDLLVILPLVSLIEKPISEANEVGHRRADNLKVGRENCLQGRQHMRSFELPKNRAKVVASRRSHGDDQISAGIIDAAAN